MAASEVATLGSFVVDTASKIQELGNNWYKASEAWKDFPRQVETLRRKHEFWQAELTKFGVLSDLPLIQTLREAKLLLEEEEAKLSKRSAKASGSSAFCAACWPKLSMTVFPVQVGLKIGVLITAFDDLPALLKYQEEAAAALEKRQLRRPFSLFIRKDPRYVPMQVLETAVQSALEKVNRDGLPSVVLLHGGPGKGKSTLARAVALHYKEPADTPDTFEHVVYLECGQRADILDKQFNLLQLLGTLAADAQEEARKFDTGSDWAIRKRIQFLLKDRKLLIVFDDVREGEFLQRMVDLCGNRVKCLVTSQLGDLCRGLNFVPIKIQIEDVQLKDARKILASHLGLQNHIIPEYLEKIADKIIQETEGNPLALASIAAAIDNTRSDEVDAWEAASNELLEMLQFESPEYILSIKYPRSFWGTMKLAVESLGKHARNLLILVHMCGGLSVPEEVINLLYQGAIARFGYAAFTKSRKELESRELVQITLISESPLKQRSWSIHSLQKLFIEEEMKDLRESIFMSLMEPDSSLLEVREVSMVEEEVKITLIALYFDERFAMTSASKMGIDITSKLYKLRCSAIEPVTRLLGQPLSDRWTQKLRTSAKQVFMRYICNGVLDEGISDLLESPISTMAMIFVIRHISMIEETCLLNKKSHRFMNTLIGLLQGVDDKTSAMVREDAGVALALLCYNTIRSVYILTEFPSVLDIAIRLLSTESDLPQIGFAASLILAHLSFSGEVNALRTIVQHPRALVCLLKSLDEKQHPSLQNCAVIALGNLAYGDDDIKLKIINSDGALMELVKVSLKADMPECQTQVVRAFCNLARGDGEIKLKLVNFIEMVDVVVMWLSKDDNPGRQEWAIMFLCNLASGSNETKLKIVNFNGVLKELVTLLSKDNNFRSQELAASALAILTFGLEDDISAHEIQLKIINSDGVLEELFKWLSKDEGPNLRKEVAKVLVNLACGDGEIKLKVINFVGAMKESFKCLSKNDNLDHDLQELVARYLAKLASGDGEIKLSIINSEGALEGLVKLLSKHDNCDHQEWALKMIDQLVEGVFSDIGVLDLEEGQFNKLKLTSTQGLMDGLINLLGEHIPPHIQAHAVRALTLIYPTQASEAHLFSGLAYYGRGERFSRYGHYKASLGDLDMAHNLHPDNDMILRFRGFVKAKLGDYQGAFVDINNCLAIERTLLTLQERGILKQLMGDLHGALEDLDEVLNLETEDYECLKHRGYVKFLMKDEVGAIADAKWALKVKPPRVDDHGYGHDCLGSSSVEYMGYKLR